MKYKIILFTSLVTASVVFGYNYQKNKEEEIKENIALKNKILKEKEEERDLLIRLENLKKIPVCHYAVNVMNKEFSTIHTSIADIRSRRGKFNNTAKERVFGYTPSEIKELSGVSKKENLISRIEENE